MPSTNLKIVVLIVAVSFIGACGAFYVASERGPVVTLVSIDDGVISSKTITDNGFADLVWMDNIGERLRSDDIQGAKGLNFAGWYTDRERTVPFYKFTVITESITLYADWNELDFTLTMAAEDPAKNTRACTFTNTTSSDAIASTSWTVIDSFKSNNNVIADTNPGGTGYSASIGKGMYDVTMTVTFSDDVTKTTTRPEVVGGTISDTVRWKDYYNNEHTMNYSFQTEDYIVFAKQNWKREFKIPRIAEFAVYETDIEDYAITVLADNFKKLSWTEGSDTVAWNDLDKQKKLNLIASFVNNGLSPTKENKNNDWYYYRIPGVHSSDMSVEYYRYPMEALYDRTMNGGLGDCDCHAIITAALMKACGYDSGIMVLTKPKTEGHAIAAVKEFAEDEVPAFVVPKPYPASGTPQWSFMIVDGYYGCETFRPDSGATPWLGNFESKYQDTAGGWTQRVFAVT
jgi:uncharacterized repeat protein (TIGR02543 family)